MRPLSQRQEVEVLFKHHSSYSTICSSYFAILLFHHFPDYRTVGLTHFLRLYPCNNNGSCETSDPKEADRFFVLIVHWSSTITAWGPPSS